MLIDSLIKFGSHLKLLIIVIAVIRFHSLPDCNRHNCYCTETEEVFSLRLHFLLLQPWFCF